MAKRRKKNNQKRVEVVEDTPVRIEGKRISKPNLTTRNPYRVRQEDMEEAIFRPKMQEGVLSHRASVIGDAIVYTAFGKNDDEDEEGNPLLWDFEYKDDEGGVLPAEDRDEAYAKVVQSDTGESYFIKKGPGGFFNPTGMFSEGNANKKRLGMQQWQYFRVNKKVFTYYLTFLRTKNVAWLKNAEREAV